MHALLRFCRPTCLFMCLLTAFSLHSQVNVLTQHNDNARTGQNTQETGLTPSNIGYKDFGLYKTVTVDGQIYAQPLVLSSVSIGGGTHNVVYVATENDSVYAFDADSGVMYWHTSFLSPGVTAPTGSQVNCSAFMPQFGVTSTPVIDPSAGVIYVVAFTVDSSSNPFHYRLHALNVSTGLERSGSPVEIRDPDNLFDAGKQNQRTGLLLENGHVIFGFSSLCDSNNTPWYGMVFSYNAATLNFEDVFVAVPQSNEEEGGVWMGGDGVAADAAGNLYLSTGNGNFNGSGSFGDTIVKLPPPPLPPPSHDEWTPSDWYTPYFQATLAGSDLDLASGGVLLLPDLPSGTAHYQRLVQAGKEGTVSIADRNNLGHYIPGGPDTDILVQEFLGALPQASAGAEFGSPSYWNGHIYFAAVDDYVRAFSFNTSTGAVSSTPVAESPTIYGSNATGTEPYSGTTSVSSNGTANGIVWVLDSGTGILHALDASTLSELYNSHQLADRDSLNGGIKFLAPTIANGKVYVGSNSELGIYEVLAGDYWGGHENIPLFGACKTYFGGAQATASQAGVNSVDWAISAATSGTISAVSWSITDSSGTIGSGTILGASGSVKVSRAPVSQPTVKGSITATSQTHKCVMSFSFQPQGTP